MMISCDCLRFIIMFKHVTGIPRRTFLLILTLVVACEAYEQIDSSDKLMNYHEQHSQYPIIHVYHNHHFSQSRQF